ncbi:MAG: prolipoprotein diacylglyceryl transferase [Elusimicrobia bacterium]|nr:prolipoprotein diacylglyceryl transferase [Elusimicrobiota bacterium]
MLPILVALGPFKLYGYGAAITLGGVLGARFLWLRRARMGLRDDESFWALINLAVMAGFLGGKLLFILQYGWTGFNLMNGYSAFGGFVSVPLAIAGFAYWKKIPFLKLADYMFLTAAFWHAFGRLGCFLAGCCYGKPTGLPWGVAFRDPRSMVPRELLGVRLHPVQLYEAAADLLVAYALYRVLLATEAGKYKPGLVVAAHLAAYGVLRASLELLRADTLPLLGPLTQGQALGAGLLLASAAVMAWRRRCSPSC